MGCSAVCGAANGQHGDPKLASEIAGHPSIERDTVKERLENAIMRGMHDCYRSNAAGFHPQPGHQDRSHNHHDRKTD